MLTMATIYVDGKEYDVNGSENLLQACLSRARYSLFLLASGAGKRWRFAASVRLSSIKTQMTHAVA